MGNPPVNNSTVKRRVHRDDVIVVTRSYVRIRKFNFSTGRQLYTQLSRFAFVNIAYRSHP